MRTKYDANETMKLIGPMSPFRGCKTDLEAKERNDQMMDIVEANVNEPLLALASDSFCLGYIAGLREERKKHERQK